MLRHSVIQNYLPGPDDRTLWQFMNSNQLIRGLMGPVGGAKTVAALMQFLIRMTQQAPSPIDNIRRTRWACFRENYRDLERTTLRTWWEWVPKEAGEWRGGANGEPGLHTLKFPMADGTEVHSEILFIGVGDKAVEAVAGGLEITGALLNEGTLLPFELYEFLLGRLRYPGGRHGGPTWRGLWTDFNAPNFDHEFYKVFVENLVPGGDVGFFRQPGGMDPRAENLQNLPGGREYYEKLVENREEWWIRRFVDNEFGHSRDGKPVFPEYDDRRHVAKSDLKPKNKRRKIMVGLDSGRNPAAAFEILSDTGQLWIFDEMVTAFCGAREFGERLKNKIAGDYSDYDFEFRLDPAAFNPTELSENNEDVFAEIAGHALGQQIKPAATNDTEARRASIRNPLMRDISAQTPGLVLCPNKVPTIRRGFQNNFKYKKLGHGSSAQYHEKVHKNAESHVCEAAEYAAMELTGVSRVIGRSSASHKMRQWAELSGGTVNNARADGGFSLPGFG